MKTTKVWLIILGLAASVCVKMTAAEPPAMTEKTVACIADLKNVDPLNFAVVHVLDYYATRSDATNYRNSRRGGGTFRWVTDANGTDDGGSLIATSVANRTGIWERVLDGETP